MKGLLSLLLAAALMTATAAFAPQGARVGLRVIVVDTEAEARGLRARIGAGEDFGALAAQYSTDPTRDAGGYLGTVAVGDLSPEFQDALEGLGPGETSAVTEVGREYVLLQVLGEEESDWIAETTSGLQAFEQGRYSEAEQRLTEAVRQAESLGPLDYRLNVSLSTLAGMYRAQGKYAEAERFYRRALTVAEEALGPDHPDLAASLSNLALLYQDQKDYAQAEALFGRALDMSVRAVGPNHPNVALAYNNLAGLRRDQGNYSRAESLYQVSLAILEQALGPEHPDVATTLEEFAAMLRQAGRAAEAGRMDARARDIRTRTSIR